MENALALLFAATGAKERVVQTGCVLAQVDDAQRLPMGDHLAREVIPCRWGSKPPLDPDALKCVLHPLRECGAMIGDTVPLGHA